MGTQEDISILVEADILILGLQRQRLILPFLSMILLH